MHDACRSSAWNVQGSGLTQFAFRLIKYDVSGGL